MAKVVWSKTPRQAWSAGAKAYESAVMKAVHQQLEYWAADVENEAKENAPWTDRTGNARQNLRGRVEEGADVSRLILQHGMDYGASLELEYGGRYSIILPTLERRYNDIFRSIYTLLR